MTNAGSALNLGFATRYEPDQLATWSYTPWHLLQSLGSIVDVTDVTYRPNRFQLAAYRATSTRRVGGGWTSPWRHSCRFIGAAERAMSKAALAARCDTVVQVIPLAPLSDLPYFVYHDVSLEATLEFRDARTGEVPRYPRLSLKEAAEVCHSQQEIYAGATGVIAMSHWFASILVDRHGLPPDKVHVVTPGASAAQGMAFPIGKKPVRESPRRHLLFAGKFFALKGGDLVLKAFQILRDQFDPMLRLTIVGPSESPGSLPDGVRFLGRLPIAKMGELYETADLLVMPSRFEAFGIVFVEALAHGIPCIGRNDFAMPEIIEVGRNGALLQNDDPEELAALIASVLRDDGIYANCHDRMAEAADGLSWDRAAREMLTVIDRSLGPS